MNREGKASDNNNSSKPHTKPQSLSEHFENVQNGDDLDDVGNEKRDICKAKTNKYDFQFNKVGTYIGIKR